MRKKIAIESTNVAALNASASHRAIDFGAANTASAPITGSRIIQVRSLVNITVLSFISSLLTEGRRAVECGFIKHVGVAAMDIKSLLYNSDKHNNDHCQYRETAKETKHIGLHFASFDVTQVTAKRRHETSRPIDQAINDVGIEGLADM